MRIESVNLDQHMRFLRTIGGARDWGGQSEKYVEPYVAAEEAGKGRGQRYLPTDERTSGVPTSRGRPSQPGHWRTALAPPFS